MNGNIELKSTFFAVFNWGVVKEIAVKRVCGRIKLDIHVENYKKFLQNPTGYEISVSKSDPL